MNYCSMFAAIITRISKECINRWLAVNKIGPKERSRSTDKNTTPLPPSSSTSSAAAASSSSSSSSPPLLLPHAIDSIFKNVITVIIVDVNNSLSFGACGCLVHLNVELVSRQQTNTRENFIETILFYIFRFSSITFIMRLYCVFFLFFAAAFHRVNRTLISIHYINIHIRVVIGSIAWLSADIVRWENRCVLPCCGWSATTTSMITLNSAITIIIIIDVGEGGEGDVNHIVSMESTKGQSRHNHIV